MIEDQRNLCRFSYLANANFEPSKMKLLSDFVTGLIFHLEFGLMMNFIASRKEQGNQMKNKLLSNSVV